MSAGKCVEQWNSITCNMCLCGTDTFMIRVSWVGRNTRAIAVLVCARSALCVWHLAVVAFPSQLVMVIVVRLCRCVQNMWNELCTVYTVQLVQMCMLWSDVSINLYFSLWLCTHGIVLLMFVNQVVDSGFIIISVSGSSWMCVCECAHARAHANSKAKSKNRTSHLQCKYSSSITYCTIWTRTWTLSYNHDRQTRNKRASFEAHKKHDNNHK